MNKYLSLQLKRTLKVFPFILSVILIIAVCFSIVVLAMSKSKQNSDEQKRFKIALTGDTDDEYTQIGLSALKNFDNSRFSMEIIELSEKEAQRQLISGEISAYVILPEDFIPRAMAGDIDTATYVTSAGSNNIVTMFKNEVTTLITDIVVYDQKAIYALREVLKNNSVSGWYGSHINNISMDFVNLIISRSEMCTIDELGISDGVDTLEYYVCSIAIIMLMIIGVAFVTVHVKNDNSLNRLLISKGHSSSRQIFCEYITHLISMIFVVLVFAIILLTASLFLKDAIPEALSSTTMLPFFLRLIPVVAMIASLNIMIFEISGSIINAVLLHFFGSIAQCYITGCLYPIYSLPDSLQKISHFLPSGVGREFLEGNFVNESRLLQLAGILIFAIIFFFIAVVIRKKRAYGHRG